MDKKFIVIVALVVLFVVTLLYWTRFQVIDVHAMNGVGFYKINRLTGETVLVSGLDQIRITAREGHRAASVTVSRARQGTVKTPLRGSDQCPVTSDQ